MSNKHCSSVRWLFLFPVAGAAAGSRPAYLKAGMEGNRDSGFDSGTTQDQLVLEAGVLNGAC